MNTSHPTLSIITPSYNQMRFIRDNLESVRQQSFPKIEHIVVDGGSTDGTKKVLSQFERETKEEKGYTIKWVSEADRGQSHAINKGLKMATGEWIGWQNSDDYYLPGAFTAFENAITNTPEADVIYGDLRIVNENGEEIAKKYHTRPSKFIQRYYSLFTANQCSFFRSNLLKQMSGVNESLDYAMDADLFWRILESEAQLTHIPEFLGAFRAHEAGKTAVISPQMREELTTVYGQTQIGRRVPDRFLSGAAAGLKAFYMIFDGRMDVVAQQVITKLGRYIPV